MELLFPAPGNFMQGERHVLQHAFAASREIDALNVVRLGFIAANGFAEQEDGYTYYRGEDLYR